MGDATDALNDVVNSVEDLFTGGRGSGGGALGTVNQPASGASDIAKTAGKTYLPDAARTVTQYRAEKDAEKNAKKAQALKGQTLIGQAFDKDIVGRRQPGAGAASLLQEAVGAPGGTEPMITTRPAAKKATMLGGRPNLLG